MAICRILAKYDVVVHRFGDAAGYSINSLDWIFSYGLRSKKSVTVGGLCDC